MSIVTTNRPISLHQLADELTTHIGHPVHLSARTADGETTVICDDDAVTQTLLDDTIDTHVPDPPPPTRVELLQAQVDELTDLMLGGL